MRIYLKDIPPHIPVFSYIRKHTNIEKYFTMPTDAPTHQLISLSHTLDLDFIRDVSLQMLEQFGYHSWKTSDATPAYGGLSLVYNPQNLTNPNTQTLGTKDNTSKQFFYGHTQNTKVLRNSYFDTMSFRKLSPCVTESNFHMVLKVFSRSLTRSRLAVLNHSSHSLWHRDETMFENIRVNIPLQTSKEYKFQLENNPPTHLAYGNVYTWDTNRPHTVYAEKSSIDRIHLVLGFTPWFDYNEEEDCFTSNEFYGEMHPLDMLIEGHVSDKIKGIFEVH